MSTALSPIVSEFDTAEQAESYDRWLRAKVQRSLEDPRPSIPHDQVMAKVQAIIDAKRKENAARSVAA
ncbi:MAG: antitoxin [Burkholderiaceae bacterium]|nr:antitoxin [Burkholderiaceae bacterium]